MHGDYEVFSPRGLTPLTRQYVRDSAIEAAASFAMLLLLQRVLLHSNNDFLVIAWLLLLLVALQFAFKWWTKDQQNATTQQFYDAFSRAEMLNRLPLNSVRILVQCYIRADALHHFGFLFAFLLENIDPLLLQPLTTAILDTSTNTKTRANVCAFLMTSYLLAAATDIREYRSLLHVLVLVALALAMKHMEHALVENKLRLAASPHFHLLSLLCAFAMSLPLWWIAMPRTTGDIDESFDFKYKPTWSTSAARWMLCSVGVAALHLVSMYYHRNPLSTASPRNRWISLSVCTITGLVGSLFVSALENNWLRFSVDLVAAAIIVGAKYCEVIRLPMNQHHEDDELQYSIQV